MGVGGGEGRMRGNTGTDRKERIESESKKEETYSLWVREKESKGVGQEKENSER